ncbi:MAG: hypothetical protein JO060_02510 [Candidatus Eremiobacteraeota bacterium]|nr:hypothetical protein [Candidatus Eremiobacteraeota bacterium]MBV9647189.1 hypothetical protein [Candidatus Eremiobacteraeota bacterium]
MLSVPTVTFRRLTAVALAAFILAVPLFRFSSRPADAQMSAMQQRRVTMLSDIVLTVIRDSSCSELQSKMQKSRSGGSRMGAGRMQQLLADPKNRAQFANAIGGPLVNKLLDCKMMPLTR